VAPWVLLKLAVTLGFYIIRCQRKHSALIGGGRYLASNRSKLITLFSWPVLVVVRILRFASSQRAEFVRICRGKSARVCGFGILEPHVFRPLPPLACVRWRRRLDRGDREGFHGAQQHGPCCCPRSLPTQQWGQARCGGAASLAGMWGLHWCAVCCIHIPFPLLAKSLATICASTQWRSASNFCAAGTGLKSSSSASGTLHVSADSAFDKGQNVHKLKEFPPVWIWGERWLPPSPTHFWLETRSRIEDRLLRIWPCCAAAPMRPDGCHHRLSRASGYPCSTTAGHYLAWLCR